MAHERSLEQLVQWFTATSSRVPLRVPFVEELDPQHATRGGRCRALGVVLAGESSTPCGRRCARRAVRRGGASTTTTTCRAARATLHLALVVRDRFVWCDGTPQPREMSTCALRRRRSVAPSDAWSSAPYARRRSARCRSRASGVDREVGVRWPLRCSRARRRELGARRRSPCIAAASAAITSRRAGSRVAVRCARSSTVLREPPGALALGRRDQESTVQPRLDSRRSARRRAGSGGQQRRVRRAATRGRSGARRRRCRGRGRASRRGSWWRCAT